MIDRYDSEAIIKIYKSLESRCEALDKFINNHAIYFGADISEYGAIDTYNNILDLMSRKNRLINLRLIVDKARVNLKDRDKKIVYLKMHYDLPMSEICGILSLGERTAFRSIEHTYQSFADELNKSKYADKLEEIIREEEWISNIIRDIKSRRMSYRTLEVNSL